MYVFGFILSRPAKVFCCVADIKKNKKNTAKNNATLNANLPAVGVCVFVLNSSLHYSSHFTFNHRLCSDHQNISAL